MDETLETRSKVSSSLRSGQLTSSSTAAARARAKAEAARAQLSFAKQEASILKQQAEQLKKKADLDAELHVLKSQKAAAAALAEAQAWEASAQESEHPQQPQLDGMQQISPLERVQEYVQQQSELGDDLQTPQVNHPELLSSLVPQPATAIDATPKAHKEPSIHQPSRSNNQEFTPLPVFRALSPKRESCNWSYGGEPANYDRLHHPQSKVWTPTPVRSSHADTSDLTRYLIRKEMISSGLLRFDDRPENYWAWKASFLSSIQDLGVTPQEELDLLSKWLGPQSAAQAKRVRAAYINNPTAGLQMVWQRLEECFGAPEVIEHALLKKIQDLPKLTNRDNQRLRELGDLLLELHAAKTSGHLPGLSHLDTAHGVNPILEKLPYNLQEKWVAAASRFKRENAVSYPPFSFFVKLVNEEAKIRNDPSFSCVTSANANNPRIETMTQQKYRSHVSAKRTEIASNLAASPNVPTGKNNLDPDKQCPLHCKPHPLRKCRLFKSKTLEERKAYLKDNNICFKCCSSVQHMAKDCPKSVQCTDCGSERHITALHPNPRPQRAESLVASEGYGGEEREGEASVANVTSKCTEVCGDSVGSRSCSKICLVRVYPAGQPEKAVKMYAVLDEQSNRSLAKTYFFDIFNIEGQLEPYTLKTCSGVVEIAGRRARDFILESLDGTTQLPLPTLIECDMIPDDRTEIPSPEVTHFYPHLKAIKGKIPEIDPEADILLLLGRDILRVHKVREQHNGLHNEPYAQRLDLGWVIVGEVCLGEVHKTSNICVYKTNILPNGRASLLSACPNNMQVKEKLGCHTSNLSLQSSAQHLKSKESEFASQVFQRTQHDDVPAMSIDDESFLKTLDEQVYKDSYNTWVSPLPFRSPRNHLPNNRPQALKRLASLRRTLEKKPQMRKHFIDFMQRMFVEKQAEPAPPLKDGEERWYLPIFGVYHPQKPEQIRVVFDSSAKHEGVSLNDVLLSGPDLNNTLLGVLIRFRREPIAVTADVQQMFYCFKVCEEHRNFLRFLWYENNDLQKAVKEFRMTVHVFGNSPSPAVAIYCLRQAAKQAEDSTTSAREFITRNFYVDDGLASFPNEAEATGVLHTAQAMLAKSNIKLHKIASNSSSVMQAFPPEDLAKDLKDLDLGVESLPLQRSLGLIWNLETDNFTFCVSKEEKPLTKRGILSAVNSLFDPLGFVVPVTVGGRHLVRNLSIEQYDWDTPLPASKQEHWKLWKDSMKDLDQLQIPRLYVPVSLSTQTQHRELCVFSDASVMAIAAVAYLKTISATGEIHVGFVMAKAKLAPHPAHTVPRLELCAAVLATEMAVFIQDEMDIDIHSVTYYTDSKIVLGYIYNTSRRFYVYVSNRIAQIRKSSRPDQWHYITTEENPADHGTRPTTAAALKGTNWFTGPSFLLGPSKRLLPQSDDFELIHPEVDPEVRPEVTTFSSMVKESSLGAQRFLTFSTWRALTRAVSTLIKKAGVLQIHTVATLGMKKNKQ
ncbi:uncharacterized protein LOC120732292 [Simochromis diagramma]|uniref:uncharacterized protein LOC120732292 n=1 Tax=Simochromis diagramma TaxID=43689 RepID=UPI001A7E5F6B|nr:uncharacterized protein LOC120732292 [Simochromis diagramma]